MDFYEQAKSYLQELECNLIRCNKVLAQMPEGRLVVHSRSNRFEFYCYQNGKQTYISHSETEYISKLAQKAYLTHFQKYAENEIAALQAYFRVRRDLSSPTQFLKDNPAISPMIAPKIFKGTPDLKSWAQAPYDQTGFREEELTIQTAQGHFVRSKSECIIADSLFATGVPYRYENILFINGETYRPDFEIYTINGKHIIWEHLGLMSNKEYVRRATEKIKNYIYAGFVPGVNLILTADEKDGTVINSFVVHQIIRTYLL
ncbi:MAG: hypothetical protein MJ086_01755 [Lachnospiraceae bacterium]|nr:hypothetical protein [Lachnospiraceae bacterium]